MGDELILVVDDNQGLCEAVCSLLQGEDYRTLMAHTGKDGIRLARDQQPDLILLDYELGDMQAPDVIENLKRRQLDIPIVLITGEGSEQIAVNVFRLGIRDYLIKPVRDDDLVRVVERSLKERRLQRKNDYLTAQITATLAKLNRRNEILRQRNQELNVLFNVTRSLTGAITLDSLLPLVVNAAVVLTSCSEGSLFLVENGALLCRAVKTPHEQQPRLLHDAAHDRLAQQALETRRLVVDDGLAAPMIIANRPIGALVVRARANGASAFTDTDSSLLTMLCNIAAAMFDGVRQGAAAGGGGAPAAGGAASAAIPARADIIFVSHSSQDWNRYVAPLVRDLSNAGLKTWVYRHDRTVGDFMDKINRMLNKASCLVLCATPRAMESQYVQMEYRYFFHLRKPIVPVLFEPVRLPAELISLDNVPGSDTALLVRLLRELVTG